MAYNLKDVFYLGATHEYPHADYNAANEQGNIPIDISAYVDPIAKGRQRGQGLAVYKVHYQVAGNSAGIPQLAADEGMATFGLTVKPYGDSGDDSGELENGDLRPDSDLAIFLASFHSPANYVAGGGYGVNGEVYLEPSTEVPYVCVRDTIFQIFQTGIAMSSADSMFISYRLECALVTLDTATLNQLLRTQTA
tara:strand:- start:333 stop:914 length:582 start_codon:yes stop_codon:yes gene_type:complete